jgi:hypothetical protein
MKVVILQSNYIPWKGYFDLINDADVFVFYDIVKYTKNDWRNRNQIYSRNGLQWITIPVPSISTNQSIDQVQITDKKWQDIHFKSLMLTYKKAKFYYQLEELMYEYLINNKWDFLSNLNQFLIKYISKKIGIKTNFINSSDFSLEGDKIEKLLIILESLNATEYISGIAAQNYLKDNEFLFEENNIKLKYKNYPNYPKYSQLSSNFVNNVSIVDMIAHIEWTEIKNFIWNIGE